VLWLQDFLPKSIPEARILSFGYDSNLSDENDAVAEFLAEHARQLLNKLSLYRKLKEVSLGPSTTHSF